ncbi:uncharacterized protein LOC129589607 isoform X2 [Paramacrobiotus metropolitanus]|uniref:uncharacterized protein LOC129589607 isoform X2 n=1 Tax=Paramacrobiotus metropolitanus TaxID=2943436 RepID=UPI002445DC22|nr:uncharacterized protein LOC129589607 isoform X2 [Paramacrobiotus metropolitanus]
MFSIHAVKRSSVCECCIVQSRMLRPALLLTLLTAAVGALITKAQFQEAVSQLSHAYGYAAPSDALYESFISAAQKAKIASKRELAMFLANILHGSNGLATTEEYGPPYTPAEQDPEHPERSYHGRGYLMLRGFPNYKTVSTGLYGDDRLVKNPDLVSEEAAAWDTAGWFWGNKVHGQDAVQQGQFGASHKIVHGGDGCGTSLRQYERYEVYKKILAVFEPNEVPDNAGCN